MKSWLIDAGPLVAYLDASDRFHGLVADCLDGFSGQLVTTSAVITESMHLVASVRHGPALLAELVSSAGIKSYDLCAAPYLREAAALMEKYPKVQMDFADATLLLLAESLDVREILTLDRRGFSTYRTRSRRALTMVLHHR